MKNLLTLIILLSSYLVQAQTTWYEITTNTDKQLNTICFPSETVGYIGGNDSLLLKSIDGGKTWLEIAYSGITFYPNGEHFVNLKFVSETVGYATVGPYSGTFKTTDGGLTWTPITFVGTMCYNQGMYFWDENNGMVGGSGCFQGEYVELIDAGTWVSSTVNTPSWTAQDIVLDIDFLDLDFGLALSKNRFLRTTDGGVTWDTIPSGTVNPLTSVEIINDTLAYAGYIDESSSFGILKTTDAGLTWSEDIDIATFYYPDYNDVGQSNNGYVYAVGASEGATEGLVFEDKGAGWWFYPVDQPLRSLASYEDSTVFAVGDSGFVVTNIDPALMSTKSLANNDFDLNIYPNPAFEILSYTIDGIIEFQPHHIKVYDISGREVFAKTSNINTLNLTQLKNGIYILEISNEEFSINRKFLKN